MASMLSAIALTTYNIMRLTYASMKNTYKTLTIKRKWSDTLIGLISIPMEAVVAVNFMATFICLT